MRRAIAGVVVGALLLVGCSGGSDDGGASGDDTGTVSSTTLADGTTTTGGGTTASTAADGPTTASWAVEADAICRTYLDAFLALPEITAPEGVGEQLVADVALKRTRIDALRALAVPADEGAEDVEGLLELLDGDVVALEAMVTESGGDYFSIFELSQSDEHEAAVAAFDEAIAGPTDRLGVPICAS